MRLDIKKTEMRNDAGTSLMEYIIALLLVATAFAAWLNLTATGVSNGTFTKRLGDVKDLASSKAAELAKQSDELVKAIPKNQRFIGSIAPGEPMEGFFDELDESGRTSPVERKTPVKFERQWIIGKDLPGKGEVTVFVSVAQKIGNRLSILRIAKAVKTDGLTVTNN